MAYKPYKINKGNQYINMGDIDENKQKHNKRYEIVRIPYFGFRSGIAWKMIPAIIYYFLAAVIIFFSIIGEFQNFDFEAMDYLIIGLKYVFIIILAYSPMIFLSDFKYVKHIPLFRSKEIGPKICGMLIVIVFCYFMIETYIYCTSDTYKNSSNVYYEMKEKDNEESLKAYSESTSETTTEDETTAEDESTAVDQSTVETESN